MIGFSNTKRVTSHSFISLYLLQLLSKCYASSQCYRNVMPACNFYLNVMPASPTLTFTMAIITIYILVLVKKLSCKLLFYVENKFENF